MSIAQQQRLKQLYETVEAQGKALEDLKARLERIETQRKPGRPPKNG